MGKGNLEKQSLPLTLKKILDSYEFTHNEISCSNHGVFQCISKQNHRNYYLKIGKADNNETLIDEMNRLLWLKQFTRVPDVVHYQSTETREFLLLSEVPGLPAHQFIQSKREIVKTLARGLRQLHQLPIENCPFDESLSMKLSKAKYNVLNGFVDESDLDKDHQHLGAASIYDLCFSQKPEDEDFVITHGDYCMPNIIVDGPNYAFIDLGRMGIADRYQDLSLACRSINHNFDDPMYGELFLKEYGEPEVNQGKMNYFRLLDELF